MSDVSDYSKQQMQQSANAYNEAMNRQINNLPQLSDHSLNRRAREKALEWAISAIGITTDYTVHLKAAKAFEAYVRGEP